MKTVVEYLKKGELTIIGGRPAMGKTTFALNLADELTLQNQAVLYCSLEMPMAEAKKEYNYNGCFLMDDTPQQKVSDIRNILQKRKDESCPITAVIIDYLQLMSAETKKPNREEELLQDLKTMAVEENISVIATYTLDRSAERRNGGRPAIEDLHLVTVWENMVNNFILLYRPEYYGYSEDEIGGTTNRVDVLIACSRNKPCRTIYYEFDKERKNYHRIDFEPKYRSTNFSLSDINKPFPLGKHMEKIDIMKHVKDLTTGTMTVVVNFPFYMERHLRCLPFTRDDYSRFISKDGFRLSLRGSGMAKSAIEDMTKIGLFFLLYEEELRKFYDEYNKEKKIVDDELEAATQRTRSETDWRKHAPLIREQFEVKKKVDSLFGIMYRECFGKCAPVLSEEGIDRLKKLSEKSLNQ